MYDSTPLITVVVPTYNSPDLYCTLNSILIQDYPRIQLIVTDDATPAFSKERVKQFLEECNSGNLEQILVLDHERNQGTVRNLNGALKLCRGEYIFNLAGDDCFYDSRVLSDWVSAFQKTGAQVMTAYRAIYDEGMNDFSHIEPNEKQVNLIQNSSPQALFESLAGENFIFGCCTARTAKCIDTYGLFDEQYHLIEDHPMNLKLLRIGEPIVFFDRVVVKYRGGGSSSPIRYNAVYAADVDMVMQKDVLPYTAHPIRMQWKYYQWKKDQKQLRRRARLLQKYKDNKVMWLLIQAWYYMHYPWRTLCRIPNRIRKWQNKGACR